MPTRRIDELARALTAAGFVTSTEGLEGEPEMSSAEHDPRHHLGYLFAAVDAGDPSLYRAHLDWVAATLPSRGVDRSEVVRNLGVVRTVLREHLTPEEWARTAPFLDAGLERLPSGDGQPPTCIQEDAPHADLARTYMEHLLRGDRRAAGTAVIAAVNGGADVRDIYLHVLAPCQREVGRLWQLNLVTVAQEHLFTAATQLIMSQLYPYVFSSARAGRRLVATAVGDEMHEVGIRMVADFLEMDGWDTYYLGASTPHDAVVAEMRSREADLVAVSATMTSHVPAVTRLVAAIRASDPERRTRVMVGGHPFTIAPGLWSQVGADAMAVDAADAVRTANRLVGRDAGVPAA